MRLLDLGFFRSGSDRHMRSSETYGLTTMLREHVRCGQGEITFSCAAKGGVETVRALEQVRAVTRALLRRLPGGDRFLASCVGGFWRDPHSDDLNEASRRLAGAEVTAKGFRTWVAGRPNGRGGGSRSSGRLRWMTHRDAMRSTLYCMTEQGAPYISHPRVLVHGVCPGKPGEPPFRIMEIDGQVIGEARTVTDVLEAAASYGITIHDLDDPDMVRWVGGGKYTWTLH